MAANNYVCVNHILLPVLWRLTWRGIYLKVKDDISLLLAHWREAREDLEDVNEDAAMRLPMNLLQTVDQEI